MTTRMPVRITHAIMRGALPIACVLAPGVAVSLLVLAAFGKSLLSFTPVRTDEIDYWREINTFGHVGFAGGYYAIDEHPAPAAFSHFGAHGAAFPLLFGWIAASGGWGIASGPLVNLACLAGAMALYFWLARLNTIHIILATLSILVFWPILLYIPSTMEETLHQSLAVLLAGIFYVLISRRDRAPAWVFGAGIVVLLVASLLRPTWAPLFLPLFLFRAKRLSWRQVVWATAGTVPIILVTFAANAWLSSPFPNFLATLQQTTEHSFWSGTTMFLSHLWGNLKLFLLHGMPLERGLRYQVLVLLACALGFLGYSIYRARRAASSADPTGPDDALDTLSLFHALNLIPVLALTLAFYDVFDWRDFRVFAPHVLLTMLVSIPFIQHGIQPALARQVVNRRLFVFVPLTLNLLLAVAFLPTFASFNAAHFATYARPRLDLAHAVTYQPGANPWRNTILVDVNNYTPALLALPPGIGVSLILAPSDLKQPIKSHYLLVRDATMRMLGNPPGWKLLGTTSSGSLYVYDNSQNASP